MILPLNYSKVCHNGSVNCVHSEFWLKSTLVIIIARDFIQGVNRKQLIKQECIPVGYLPSTRYHVVVVVVGGGGGFSLTETPLDRDP